MPRRTLGVVLLVGLASPPAAVTQQPATPVLRAEFLSDRAPFPSVHASTIVETPKGLVAAWFGGTREGDPDVAIWLSRNEGDGWSAPVVVADGLQPDGARHPCWNPVLVQPSSGPLLLFYKVGPSPAAWWGMVRTSPDHGRTWSASVRLPGGILGPIRAKPVELADGTLLAGSSTEHAGWVVHLERFRPESLAVPGVWERTGPLNDTTEFGAIQPTLLVHSPTRIQILCRSRQGVITQAWSDDAGRSWSRMVATTLPNPNAGIDAVRLTDRRFLLAYNPTTRGRDTLALAVSRDGTSWHGALVLEDGPGEYSYPALIQTRDGLVHVTYTWRRERIKHVVIDPARIR
jgi:predicted neuraminidase